MINFNTTEVSTQHVGMVDCDMNMEQDMDMTDCLDCFSCVNIMGSLNTSTSLTDNTEAIPDISLNQNTIKKSSSFFRPPILFA